MTVNSRAGSLWVKALSTLVLATAIIGLLPAAAQALGEFEPNDSISAATGPLAGNTAYKGTLETEQDEDWFWIPIAGQQQVTLSVVFHGSSCWLGEGHVSAELLDQAGKEITSVDAILQDEGNKPQTFSYTTPPAARAYYVLLSGGGGGSEPPCEYEFSISPATAISPAPAQNPVVSLGEPDNFKDSAHGPLAGEVLYAGSIDATGDVDQLYLEAKPGRQLSLELVSYGCEREDGVEGVYTPFGKQAIYNELVDYETGRWNGVTVDTEGGGSIYVALSGSAGCDWQFWASPASALLTQPKVPKHVDPCARAQRRLGRSKRAVHSLSKRLHHARSARSRGRLHHLIEVHKRAVRAAKHQIHVHCSQQ